jgi:flagellar basal-body rod protein FlgB
MFICKNHTLIKEGGKYQVNIYGNSDIIKKAMDGAMLRENALSQNLSNINTPNYKRKDVEFQAELDKAISGSGKMSLKVTDDRHISKNSNLSSFSPKVKTQSHISARRDGNGTTVDVEMAEKAKNAIIYNALVGQISRKFNSLKYVISEGGK